MKRWSVILSIVISCLLVMFEPMECSIFGEMTNPVTTLRDDLLKGYKASARPAQDPSTNTTVKFAISLNSISLDDHAQRMSAVMFLRVGWKDEFLRWDPSQSADIKSLHFDRQEIWTPDIALFNSAKSTNVAPTSTLPLLCQSDGSVIWVPPFSAEVPCKMDIADWPSDAHTCLFRFGSWAHHGEQINIELAKAGHIYMDFYESNMRWSIVNHTAMKESTNYDGEIYQYVDFKITVKREAASHAAYVTQTTFAVMLIILGSYLLPICYHLSRFLLHLFSMGILVSCNFVLFLSLPATGGSIPHVVKYFSGTIVLTTLSLLSNVIMATCLTTTFRLDKFMSKTFETNGKSETSRTEIGSSEIAYSTLEEDLVSLSSSHPPREDTQSTQKISERADTRRILKILNGVLLVMFALAFVIDYSVMRSTIGY